MEDLEGVSMLRDVLDVLLVHLLDAVLPGHVLHQVLELLKSPQLHSPSVPGLHTTAAQHGPAEKASSNFDVLIGFIPYFLPFNNHARSRAPHRGQRWLWLGREVPGGEDQP